MNKKVPIFYWKPNRPDLKSNFGDEMAVWILSRMTNAELLYVNGNQNGKLLTIGSILNHYALNGDYIWGSGINGKLLDSNGEIYFTPYVRQLNVYAVRGELTRNFLLSKNIICPEVYGDPGLLFSHLYPEYKYKPKKGKVKIFSHYHDKSYFNNNKFIIENNITIIHADWDFNRILDEVLECEFLMSTALHGLIIADSFNIPNRYLRISEHENMFKFDDYYSGTNRHNYKYGKSIKDALDLGGVDFGNYDINILLNSFPIKD